MDLDDQSDHLLVYGNGNHSPVSIPPSNAGHIEEQYARH